MAKSIIYNDEARRALERGIDLLAEAVCCYFRGLKVVT